MVFSSNKYLIHFLKIPWWLARPRLYNHWFRYSLNWLKYKIKRLSNPPRSTLWCEDKCKTIEDFFTQNLSSEYTSLSEAYSNDFEKSLSSVKKKGWFGDYSNDNLNYFQGSASMELLFNISEKIKAKRAIETGVSHGWSSLSLLLSLRKRKGSLLISTDMPYRGSPNEEYVGCAVNNDLHNMWKLVRMPDRDCLHEIVKKMGKVDICHYDSDKTYEGRMWAYEVLWNSLRKGGYFISDDISDNYAFKDFFKELEREVIVVKVPDNKSHKFVGVVVK